MSLPQTAEPTVTEARERRLVLSLGLFDLTGRDRALLRWLATWDQPTVDAVADLLARLVEPARSEATR